MSFSAKNINITNLLIRWDFFLFPLRFPVLDKDHIYDQKNIGDRASVILTGHSSACPRRRPEMAGVIDGELAEWALGMPWVKEVRLRGGQAFKNMSAFPKQVHR